jgi:NADH-quinone oxidoreductase subunit I
MSADPMNAPRETIPLSRMFEPVSASAPTAAAFRFRLADVAALLKGMWVTLGYLVRPSRVVTREYPENRDTLTFADRFRGQVVMPHDAEGEHNCTACTLCEKACPNGSNSILTTRNIADKRVLGRFVYRLSSCTLCNLCIEACPFDAIRMGRGVGDIEASSYDRASLDIILNKSEGR